MAMFITAKAVEANPNMDDCLSCAKLNEAYQKQPKKAEEQRKAKEEKAKEESAQQTQPESGQQTQQQGQSGGGRDARKINQDRKASAAENVEKLRAEPDRLRVT